MSKLDFNTSEEKKLVREVFENATDVLSDDDKMLPQVRDQYVTYLRVRSENTCLTCHAFSTLSPAFIQALGFVIFTDNDETQYAGYCQLLFPTNKGNNRTNQGG